MSPRDSVLWLFFFAACLVTLGLAVIILGLHQAGVPSNVLRGACWTAGGIFLVKWGLNIFNKKVPKV